MISGEVYAGDTWVFDDEKSFMLTIEEVSIYRKTMSLLPEETYVNMKILGLEFEKGQSPEARD